MDPWYFCWCLNHDPENYYNHETHWQLQLYMNTIRLYRHADHLREILPSRLRNSCPKGFKYVADDHSVQLVWNFECSDPFDAFPKLIPPMLVRALESTAPIFDEIFSILSKPAAESKTRHNPSARPAADTSLSNPGGELSRNIPPAMRARVRASADHCALCGLKFKPGDDIHIDHIIPWSKGGLTVEENLQATHAECNLTKGNRG